MLRAMPKHPKNHPLKQWRLDQNLRQEDIADRAGVTQITVSRAERGLHTAPAIIEKFVEMSGGVLSADDFKARRPRRKFKNGNKSKAPRRGEKARKRVVSQRADQRA